MFIVIATLVPKPEKRAEYLRLIQEEVAIALQHEPGIVQFNILADVNDPTKFYALEIYESQAMYDHHHAQPWFQKFISTTKDWYAVRGFEIRTQSLFPADNVYTHQDRKALPNPVFKP